MGVVTLPMIGNLLGHTQVQTIQCLPVCSPISYASDLNDRPHQLIQIARWLGVCRARWSALMPQDFYPEGLNRRLPQLSMFNDTLAQQKPFPILHHLPPLLEQIGAVIGGFCRAADSMGEGTFGQVPRISVL